MNRSKKFRRILVVAASLLFAILYLFSTNRKCYDQIKTVLLRDNPEFSAVLTIDNQGDEWYFRMQSDTSSDQYVFVGAAYCSMFPYFENEPDVILGKIIK